jgi:phosphocarrier protein
VTRSYAPPDARGGGSQKTLRASVVIVNRRGLHARAAAKFVTSIMGLMVLAAAIGSQLEIRARGREAAAALAALVALVERGFDEN